MAVGFQRTIQVGSLEKVAFGWKFEDRPCIDGRKTTDAKMPRAEMGEEELRFSGTLCG